MAASALAISSCGWLDKLPESDLSPETYFRNETDLKLFSNPLYNNLLDDNVYGHQDDQILNKTLSDVLQGGSARTVPQSGGGWSWSNLTRINILLGNIDNCADEAARLKYTGVAKFFRAYFYFDKVKRFGDVPWIDHELTSDDPLLYAPRDNREVILTHMIEDIDEAIQYLPETEENPYRLTKWAALALKSRFCLHEGTFRKYHSGRMEFQGNDAEYYLNLAAEASREIMDSGRYHLYSTDNPDEDYVRLFAKENADPNEYILARCYNRGVAVMHDASTYPVMASHGKAGFSKKMVDSYLMRDGSRFTDKEGWATMEYADEVAGRDPRLAQTMRTPTYKMLDARIMSPVNFEQTVTGFQTIKFVMSSTAEAAHLSGDQSTNDLPIFRYAEVLLNYAEAKAELGTLTQTDLNESIKLIRDRVGMPNLDMDAANANPDLNYILNPQYGYSNITGPNAGVIGEIRRERNIELAQEGTRRMDDLMRWREGKCIDQPMYGFYFSRIGTFDFNEDGVFDLYIYQDGKEDKSIKATVKLKLGVDIYLTDMENERGYVDPFQNIAHSFNEDRDYFYPIPYGEIDKNKNLGQNPGWSNN